MTKRIIALLGCLLVALVATGVYAGFYHTPGGDTSYDAAEPTPATFWLRQQRGSAIRGTLWPAVRPLIFAETPMYYSHSASPTNATVSHKVAFGFWEQDGSEILWVREDITDGIADDDTMVKGGWHDVEWELDDSSIVWPKE